MTLAAPSRILLAVAAAIVGIAAMSVGLVGQLGGRDARDATAEPTAASRADLARHLERAPHDGRGWVLLARMDLEADRFGDAVAAYERALESGDKVARDPGIWCEYADALGMAQGGSLRGRPRELVMRALAQDPAHPRALEMAGSAAFEAGEYASAVRYWGDLLARLPRDSRERALLEAAIRGADERAALR
jgi:cytochrome c-type biogenesis protein CcmH